MAAADHSIEQKVEQGIKRSLALFASNLQKPRVEDVESQRVKVACKLRDEFGVVQKAKQGNLQFKQPELLTNGAPQMLLEGPKHDVQIAGITAPVDSKELPKLSAGASISTIIESLDPAEKKLGVAEDSLVEYKRAEALGTAAKEGSRALSARRAPPKVPEPKWHAPWKLMRVVSGHTGAVRAVAVDPGNEWFVTGASDRNIKVWDLATGVLKLTLTGHIHTVRGLAVSPRHPYLFSAGEDKKVVCWDLEQNKIIRHYHGHLSGVYCMAIHPTLDLLMTAGRDAVCKVWDMRSKTEIHSFAGHTNTVTSVLAQDVDPQVITGSMDSTIRVWDLAAGKTLKTLTHHKKGVRGLCTHPREFSFVSAAADNIKKWSLPDANFMHNMSGHDAIINAVASNEDGVMVSGGDNGSIRMWDYFTGYNFQSMDTIVQPGSLDSEAGIYCMSFDKTGSRLIMGEADKSIKIYREDPDATPDTHPVDMEGWRKTVLKHKRF